MKYLPKNTLAYHHAAPQTHALDVSAYPVSTFAAATKLYRDDCGLVAADHEALTFYALNHCASVVRKSFTVNEPLPEWATWVLEHYTATTAAQGARLLHYILSITTREMRHIHLSQVPSATWTKVKQDCGGDVMVKFIKDIAKLSEGEAVSRYMNNPPEVTVGHYIKTMSLLFHTGESKKATPFFNGGYGGDPWGDVADAALKMIHGETSMEILVDTGYTLAHNGGPIFNKGMMYSGSGNALLTILDVQRSGQIPELILSTETYGVKKDAISVEAVKKTATARPELFKAFVDWFAVEAAFIVGKPHGNYAAYKAKQKVAHPAAPPKPAFKFIAGKKVKITGTYDVMPGQKVEVYERVSA